MADTGTRDTGLPPPPPTRDSDWLIGMDNSNSTTEEQASFGSELPRMIDILASGDFDQDGDFVGRRRGAHPGADRLITRRPGPVIVRG